MRPRAALAIAGAALLLWPQVSPAATTVRVRSESEFAAAISRLRPSGGTIQLLPNRYVGTLLVPGRFGGPLRIVGSKGVRVQRLLLDQTRGVTVGPLSIRPVTGDARIVVQGSSAIRLSGLFVSAQGTRFSSGVEIPDSRGVTVVRSTFTHCGDLSPNWSNCLLVRDGSYYVTVDRSWFHDCYGCDFIHGRIGAHLTVRNSRFERALPCRLADLDMRLTRYYLGRYAGVRCEHQDAIELFGGDDLRFVHNHFGVYKQGGAQLYITGDTSGALIARNVFVGTDPRVPGYRSRVGILVGGGGGGPIPYYVHIVRNKIYTGAPRHDGYAGSISISKGYHWRVPVNARPVIADNVIGLLETPVRLCQGAKLIHNVILRGRSCPRRQGRTLR